ncbi:MAG TPA: flagellar filament capping protein FliD [Burkholderiaceae bacterium]|nr:flagellar filament capping protein FliD [Burkholderiaceae bacterium]
MASITSLGVGSNLDANAIVSQLMALEKRPLSLLQQQASKIQTQISEFGKLQGQVATLRDAAAKLADANTFKALSATASDTTALSATAGSTAVAGRYGIQVDKLAQNQSLASNGVADPSASFGSGTMTITLGSYDSVGNTFTPKSGATPVAITIAAGSSLNGIRDAINAANAGVSASLVKDGGTTRLVLRSQSSGAENSVRITVSDADGNNTDATGLSALAFDPTASAGAGQNLTQTQAARDAEFRIDGLALKSASNTITDAIQGVTLRLTKETTSAVDLKLGQDNDSIKSAVQSFITAYNSLNTLIANDTRYDPSSKTGGPLQGDRTVTSVSNQLRAILRETLGSNAIGKLSDAGVRVQRDGSLTLDSTAFNSALDNLSAMSDLFTRADASNAANRGFGVRFRILADTLLGTTGSVTTASETLSKRLSSNKQLQDAQQQRLERTEARLRAQYTALDTKVSTLTQTGNALSQQLAKLLGTG